MKPSTIKHLVSHCACRALYWALKNTLRQKSHLFLKLTEPPCHFGSTIGTDTAKKDCLGHRSGRLPKLSDKELKHLYDIVESGPIAYGYSTGVWTSPIIAQVIHDEFNVEYHEGHVRKILTKIGFSVQRPTTKIVAGNDELRRKWHRYRYPNLKKTRKSKGRQ